MRHGASPRPPGHTIAIAYTTPNQSDPDEWYDDGLRFECTSCGACCTGPPGAVHFTEGEARAMARTLGITFERFMDDHTHDTPAGRSLKENESEHGYDCVFLDRDSVPGKAVCTVYDARPSQCRTFPFWPEHLKSPRAWQRLSRRCEGIGRGPLIPIDQVRIRRDA